MPGFDHLAAFAAVPRRSRSTPCALAARPVIVNALSVALPYPLTALLTHLVVLPPAASQPCLSSVEAVHDSRVHLVAMRARCRHGGPCVSVARSWLTAIALTIVSRSGASGLPGCPLRSLTASGLRHHLLAAFGLESHGDVVAAASGPGRWSPGCLRPPWRHPGSTAFKIVFSRAIL